MRRNGAGYLLLLVVLLLKAGAASAGTTEPSPILLPLLGRQGPIAGASAASRPESAPSPGADVAVTPWNERALDLCVKYRRNPLRVARALPLLHAAMYEAVHAAGSGDEKMQAVAAGAAAGPMLDYLFPLETPGRFAAMAWLLYAKAIAEAGSDRETLGNAWSGGQTAARRVIARALRDGSDRVWDPRQRPAPAPGTWRAAPPLHAYDPLEPLAASWTTWVLKDGGEVQPPPPVAYDTPEYWNEAQEVLAVSRALTPEQKRIAEDWNLDRGSITPAGVWNLKARALIRTGNLDLSQAARVLAVLNIALADAAVATWRTKFAYWTQRPVTAIRERLDPDWLPHLLTPPFPGYVSGHAAISGAASEVLATFFLQAAEALQAAAEEAALSRLYAGIHFRSDNEQGLRLGRRIGHLVLERLYGQNPASPLAVSALPSLLDIAPEP